MINVYPYLYTHYQQHYNNHITHSALLPGPPACKDSTPISGRSAHWIHCLLAICSSWKI
jgi:hypothetical protein